MDNTNIGALWLKDGKYGEFMSGKIKVGEQEINIVVFKNNKKTADKQPDYNILISKPREANLETARQEVFEDDIPF